MTTNNFLTLLASCLFMLSCLPEPEQVKLSFEDQLSIFSLDDFYLESDVLKNTVDSIYSRYSLRELVAQMIFTSYEENANDHTKVRGLISNKEVGGIVFLGANNLIKKRISEFKALNSDNSDLPLLYSIDAEPNLVNGRVPILLTKFPRSLDIESELRAENVAQDIADVLGVLGININFAPVSDLFQNKETIGSRSFGYDIEDVTHKTNSFIFGTQKSNVVATVKHFPGHGFVHGDSHKRLVKKKELDSELTVFEGNIAEGVIGVMVGHIAIENGKYSTNDLPSSISRNVVTNLLKDELEFNGVKISDAMNMEGVSQILNADLRAIKAGIDILLIPKDEGSLINQITEEVRADPIFRSQIEESVRKIIRLKICLGLITE